MSSQVQQTHTAAFLLQPNKELVEIPEEMFIWSNFLREYKKSMLVDNKGNNKGNERSVKNKFCISIMWALFRVEIDYIIPLPPIQGQPVQRAHLEKVYEFFQL